jgi:hypothetical protein
MQKNTLLIVSATYCEGKKNAPGTCCYILADMAYRAVYCDD